MNVLLVNPDKSDSRWSFRHALAFLRKKICLPPMGFLTVPGMAPGKWTMRLVDGNGSAPTEEDLKWADFAFVSGKCLRSGSTSGIVARCREAGVSVVAAGPIGFHRL